MVKAIDRTNLILSVVAIATSGIIWHGPGMIAAAIGALVAYVNFRIVVRIGSGAVAAVSTESSVGEASVAAGRLMARMALKMLALLGLIWALLTVFDLAVAPFAMGISVFVVSIVLSAAGIGPREKPQPQTEAS